MSSLIYLISSIMFCAGLYIIISSAQYFRKLVGLIILQNAVLIFFISLGKLDNSIVPIIVSDSNVVYTSPIPHVLMLTAIVVGFVTVSLAMILIKKIYGNYHSCNEDQIKKYDN